MDPETAPVLLELLICYSTGSCTYAGTADRLTSLGHRNRMGRLFTKGIIEHILSNRFYDWKAVYHPGRPAKQVTEGIHEVPDEIKEM